MRLLVMFAEEYPEAPPPLFLSISMTGFTPGNHLRLPLGGAQAHLPAWES